MPHSCPFCIGGRLFVVERSQRPKFVEYACFSCGWREYSPESAGQRQMRLEAHQARRTRNAPKPKTRSHEKQQAIIAAMRRGA